MSKIWMLKSSVMGQQECNLAARLDRLYYKALMYVILYKLAEVSQIQMICKLDNEKLSEIRTSLDC